MVICSGWRVF